MTLKRTHEHSANEIRSDKTKRSNVNKDVNIMDKQKASGKSERERGQKKEKDGVTVGEVIRGENNNVSVQRPVTCSENVASVASPECFDETMESETERSTTEEERMNDVPRSGQKNGIEEKEKDDRLNRPSLDRTKRREIEMREKRERNAKFSKMVRSQNTLKYEEELTEQERSVMLQSESKFSSGHVGRKIVDGFLLPSATVGNAEACKQRIMKYVHSRGYRILRAKEVTRG